MKRITLLLCILLLLLPSLFAATSYSGSAKGYATASSSLPLSIDSGTWLKTSSSSSDVSVVKYGFYTEASDADKIADNTITFTENYKSTSGKTDSYSAATAKAVLYFYILSNSKYDATLKWTQLSRSGSNSGGPAVLNVTVTSNGNSVSTSSTVTEASTTIYSFDPSSSTGNESGICQYGEISLSMTTESYEIDATQVTSASPLTYNGTMTLILEAK